MRRVITHLRNSEGLPPRVARPEAVLVLGLVAVLLLVSACSGIKTSYQNYRRARQGDYFQAVQRYSAYGSVYRGFETVLLVHGTYRSAAFREAYAAKYAADHRLGDADRRRLVEEETAAARKEFEFILAAYAPEKDTILLHSPRSLWTIYLEDDTGRRLSPNDVRGLERDRLRIEEYFPYITPWQELYRVRFPADPAFGGSRIHLVLTGVLGATSLTFPLR